MNVFFSVNFDGRTPYNDDIWDAYQWCTCLNKQKITDKNEHIFQKPTWTNSQTMRPQIIKKDCNRFEHKMIKPPRYALIFVHFVIFYEHSHEISAHWNDIHHKNVSSRWYNHKIKWECTHFGDSCSFHGVLNAGQRGVYTNIWLALSIYNRNKFYVTNTLTVSLSLSLVLSPHVYLVIISQSVSSRWNLIAFKTHIVLMWCPTTSNTINLCALSPAWKSISTSLLN